MSLVFVVYYTFCFYVAARILYSAFALLRNAYVGPLSKVPNAHPTVPLTSAWILWNKWQHREHRARLAAHQRMGPVIRIGPGELSIDCIDDGIRTVYGAWEKHSWYRDAMQGNSAPYMLTMLSHSVHAQRRRMVAGVYSKSSVMNSPRIQVFLQQIIDGDLVDRLFQASAADEALDVLELNKSVYLDISTAWIFGLDSKTDFVTNDAGRREILKAFFTESAEFFLKSEFAWLAALLQRFGLSGSGHSTFDQGSYIQDWIDGLCKKAEIASNTSPEKVSSVLDQDTTSSSTVFELLRENLCASGSTQEQTDASLRAECLDHILASYDVSGVVLTYLMYELSRAPTLQARLRSEIHSLPQPLSAVTAQQIDGLPLLDAILLETLRLHPSVLGPWPRVAPAGGARLGPYDGIPVGTKVSASTSSLHVNPEVFPDPEAWRPERWVLADEGTRTEMMKWLWPYGSGARGCIGNHFANRSLKHVVTRIYGAFETSVCEHGSMEHADAFVSGPIGGYLKLFVRPTRAAVGDSA